MIEEINIQLKLDTLKKRAIELSKESSDDRNSNDSISIVEFSLNDEIYAFEVKYAKHVASIGNITPIPCVPSFVLGVISLQEQIISVIDIRNFFQMPHIETATLCKVIVIEDKNSVFGIAADAVMGIKDVYIDDIQKNMDTFDDVRKKYFYGLTDKQTIILDASKILNDDEIVIRQ